MINYHKKMFNIPVFSSEIFVIAFKIIITIFFLWNWSNVPHVYKISHFCFKSKHAFSEKINICGYCYILCNIILLGVLKHYMPNGCVTFIETVIRRWKGL